MTRGSLRRAAAALLLAAAFPAHAAPALPTPAAPAQAALPAPLAAALSQARVNPANSAFAVVPLDGGALQLAHGTGAAMNPASTMKLLTTAIALDALGPDFHWHTAVLAQHAPRNGRLDGDLYVRGGGDPSLVIERWWLMVQRLRGLGLRDIRGDLVLDRSRFAADAEETQSLDGNDLRPYNVAPDALLINFKTLSLDFVPDAAAGVAHVVATPALDGVQLPATVPLAAGACGDWKAQLRADYSHPRAPVFHGSYPRACGEHTWHVSLLSPDAYALATFRALWHAAGGTLRGTVRTARAPEDAVELLDHESPSLAEVVRDINKNSNNVMARQLFLTLGPEAGNGTEVASAALSVRAVQEWLARHDLAMPELVLENGSGLSRAERISAGSMARLLVHTWESNSMPAFVASLPQSGVDGTMKNRHGAERNAFVKTGYLSEVRALAGYVFAASGHRYAVVAFLNDPRAEGAQGALDEFLEWVRREG